MRYERIPQEMKDLDQWVCATDYNKIPMQAGRHTAASSTDPSTWSSYQEALEAVESGTYSHLGFVFNDNGLVGIDIDHSSTDGLMSPVAVNIIKRVRSYTERSKSGEGFHIIVKGDIPFTGRNNRYGVEIYKASRYFIMTGKQTLFSDIIENQEAIDYVLKTYFGEEMASVGERTTGYRESHDRPRGLPRIYDLIWPTVPEGHLPVDPIFPAIANGNRNNSLTSLAGTLYNAGLDINEILEYLLMANDQACHPPLALREVEQIANSIVRYRR